MWPALLFIRLSYKTVARFRTPKTGYSSPGSCAGGHGLSSAIRHFLPSSHTHVRCLLQLSNLRIQQAAMVFLFSNGSRSVGSELPELTESFLQGYEENNSEYIRGIMPCLNSGRAAV